MEVLIALLVGSIITTTLLALAVQLLQTNQREAARSDTQRDIQASLDYIARDLREAVYVYDGNCLDQPSPYQVTDDCPGLKNFLPPEVAGTAAGSNNVPVLAFWRVDPLPEPLADRCRNNAAAFSISGTRFTPPDAIRGVPCLSQRMYTLVVYSLNWQNSGNRWRGRARIVRYQLPQFSYRRGVALPGVPEVSQGWVSPTEPTIQGDQQRETDFFFWPIDEGVRRQGRVESLQTVSGGLPTIAQNQNTVLVDFVDRQGIYDGAGGPAGAICPDSYQITPRNEPAGNNPPRGFYVCVRRSGEQGVLDQERMGALNQEVIVRIQGEAANRPGVPDLNPNKPSVPIPMETRVLTRGVVNKTQ